MRSKYDKYHFIYKTTNLLSGKYYIGMHSTNNLNDGYLGSGKRLRYSINKYGKENHIIEILEFFDTREELVKREKEIVNLNEISKKDCINLKVGGNGGFTDEEHMKKCHEGSLKWILEKWEDPVYREKMSILSSERMKNTHKAGKIKYDTFKGKKHTDESKKKIGEKNSINQKGEKNSQYGTCWIYNENFKVEKKIEKESLSIWLDKGWIKGRIKR